jgi:hypothetical protein
MNRRNGEIHSPSDLGQSEFPLLEAEAFQYVEGSLN